MKARRTLEHGDVVTELLAQLNFRVLASEAKERIETLLERDYIRRDDSNPSIYHYVAWRTTLETNGMDPIFSGSDVLGQLVWRPTFLSW
ncbi:hypothetical protein IWW55_005124 [Coemansia sp. RSA 2706]|nr:hypothetical protein IWW55_005124 [Coemansia sp. RSA 2706]